MKRILAMTAAALLVSSSAVFAAGSATLTVTAAVQGTCSFAGPGTFAFPPLDPAVPGDVSVTLNALSFTCSNGTSFTITDDSGGAPALTSTTLAPAQTIPYALSYTPTGVGTGVAQNLAITGDILFADFSTAGADAYTDSVVFTINP